MANKNAVSVVEEVRIFLRGAEIKRRMIIDTSAGKNTTVFTGLPRDVRPESINASIESGGTLISADFEIDSFAEPTVSKDIDKLRMRSDDVKAQKKKEECKLDTLAYEENFLNWNSKIGGDSGAVLSDLKDAERYFVERRHEVGLAKMASEIRLEELNEELERITIEMGSFPANDVRYSGKIVTEFYSESAGEAEIVVSYFVNGAFWTPYHEIRMNETGGPVSLSMKGSIVQSTGEDWNDVRVRLSTGNPVLGNRQPVVHPWYIDLAVPYKPAARMAMSRSRHDEPILCEAVPCVAEYDAEVQAYVMEQQTTVEFTLPAVLSIRSSDRPSKVEISKHVLEANVFHYCAGRLDTDVFLVAEIRGWEKLNLLSGDVSIFHGNEYVGKTYLDPATADDGMEISLGRDKGVIVTRERGNDMAGKSMIGMNQKALREWIITVRNTKSRDIKMKLMDQLPVSVNNAVAVEPMDISGAELVKETGILTWTLDISAGGSVKKVLKYQVTYPKSGLVYLD
ncbi:MAG: DUF4139 domain-containing protein [Methanomassiliicoccaceae archaeon]|nr:DUF4139 domain-containing protein [Methanomassiliicoccaceae archaeon]